ncbi:cell envelope integrity protein CreD [Thiothrix subterranea]|uniref:Cell envelope integrity protein CreD n=1 Tax=Thiothrix subterranea TaxID=2735563 RepID=A0AA51MND1_9GAMM|nr:cell envelope integrity protein CreD [Thiothrix subterranea]MDQ5767696.1 cell envelope integrity protein CreD [Thiothrix subterranea]WML85502.1 cell envelope integrity protein CreD [Thiothrix subterranea]
MSEQLPPQLPKSALHQLSQSLGLRTLVVMLLALLMLIPLFFADTVVKERQADYQAALSSVAERWGGKQTLTGPVLVVPYVEHFTSVDTISDENGESRVVSKDVFNDRTAILLPEALEIRANLNEEHRQQGIYDALVYNATISLSGKFNHAQVLQSSEGERRILWNKAFVALGLSDQRAVDTASSFFWNDGRIDMQPGTRLSKLLPSGFHIPLSVNADSTPSNEFKLTLNLRGSDGLFFAPLGQTTAIRMTSAWTHPNFQGDLLPNKHDITAAGFNAAWDIPHLVRSYPQYWVLEDQQTYDLHSFSAGVGLHEPDSLYTLIDRAVKYGALFIGLTFLVFLAFEISLKQRLHVLQYGLVGAALSLFYLILLAAAEHIGFLYAYAAAAATTIFSITVYTGMILRQWRQTFLLFLLLVLLYGSLYLLLQMEDYALLIGVGLLLFATLLMMYVTRHLLSTPK